MKVDAYNLEIRDGETFIGDRASRRAFHSILDDLRKKISRFGGDPFRNGKNGSRKGEPISKKKLDRMLVSGNPVAAGLLLGAIEEYAQIFAEVVKRILRTQKWRGTEYIVIGGGMSNSRIGTLAVGRAEALLRMAGIKVSLMPIHHHPDEAGLIGVTQLVPPEGLRDYDAMLAIDIGGTNVRVGVVKFGLDAAPDLSRAAVWKSVLWRHEPDAPTRDAFIDRVAKMLADLARRAEKSGLKLVPIIGVGCPGIIGHDGTIRRGTQNLPGDWSSRDFNLPHRLASALPVMGVECTEVLMHNDAVVQGLSEVPFMHEKRHWGVLTIGTGLGNARFTRRRARPRQN